METEINQSTIIQRNTENETGYTRFSNQRYAMNVDVKNLEKEL